MRRPEDRIVIASEINSAAKLYRERLVGRSFMYVFDGRYIEVIYKAANFKHLTGVDSRLTAREFYALATKGRLRAEQIGFSDRHPYALCKKKIVHISQLATLATSESFMLENVSTRTQSYKFGTTDLNFSVLMNERGGCFVAESLRDEDCFSKSSDVYPVTHIFSRRNDEKKYADALYVDGLRANADLPEGIRGLLTEPLLKELGLS